MKLFKLTPIGMLMVGLIVITSARLMPAAPQRTVDSASETVKATIVAIDKAARTVTLRGPKGNDVVVQADDNMKRFDELKVGDEITATYTESIAVNVRKAGQPAPPDAVQSLTPREGGPGATLKVQQNVAVTVQEIDRNAPSVTVRTPDKGVITYSVRDPKNLENLNVGDKVDVTFTQALLLRADAPAK
jgi:Cu/Ag efflux protein CusF